MTKSRIVWARRDADGGISTSGGDDLVPWWSCGKMALAAAALKLVETGDLALDQPLAPAAHTLRHLLQHTAGLDDYGDLPDYRAAVASGADPWPRESLLARLPADAVICGPGQQWSYSNVGYVLVRRLIEQATGEPLAKVLADLVLEPAGLTRTRLAEARKDLLDVELIDPTYHPGWVYPGFLVGPPSEAVLWLAALCENRVLGGRSMRAMTSARLLGRIEGRIARQPAYGLGLMMEGDRLAPKVIGHSGAGPGSVAAIYHLRQGRQATTIAAFASWPATDQGRLERCVLELGLPSIALSREALSSKPRRRPTGRTPPAMASRPWGLPGAPNLLPARSSVSLSPRK